MFTSASVGMMMSGIGDVEGDTSALVAPSSFQKGFAYKTIGRFQ